MIKTSFSVEYCLFWISRGLIRKKGGLISGACYGGWGGILWLLGKKIGTAVTIKTRLTQNRQDSRITVHKFQLTVILRRIIKYHHAEKH